MNQTSPGSGLVLAGVTRRFGEHVVLRDVSFTAPAGGFCVLLGPSGCGKSTLLRLVAGLDRQDAGTILLEGRRLDGLAPRERDVAMVFQSYALYPHLSARENMAFGLRVRKVPSAEIARRVDEVAGLLGIGALLDRRPGALSGGERQRVAMGRAIARKPALFLFDEPLSNLDATLRAGMRAELASLHRALGVTTLYVTHDQAEAMTLADQIVMLREGEVHQVGTPDALYRAPVDTFVARFLGTPGMNLFRGRVSEDGRVFTHAAFRASLPAPAAGIAGEPAIAGLRPEAIGPARGERPCALHAVVRLLEHHGATRWLHVRVPGEEETVVCPWKGAGPATGASIALAFDPRDLILFDAGGRAIGREG